MICPISDQGISLDKALEALIYPDVPRKEAVTHINYRVLYSHRLNKW
jgi:hypothetical protein